MDSPKYSKFDVSAVTYKVVNGQDIKAFVLTPKDIPTGNHPVVVKFHGGFFVGLLSPHQYQYIPNSDRFRGKASLLIGMHNGRWTTASSIQQSLWPLTTAFSPKPPAPSYMKMYLMPGTG